MRAAVMTAPGNPEVLEERQVPDPQIKAPTELRVRLQAAGVNPVDTKLRQRGVFYPDALPAILGCDGAGTVEAVGSAVESFQPGDAVYFCQGGLGKPGTGNYAELAVVDERFVARKPQSLSFAQAAAAPLVLITAWEGLYDRGQLQAGQSALVHAGAGGVGHVAIQLAKLQGASVATTVSTEEKATFVRQLGADWVIFYQQEDFVQAARDWTAGQGVDLAFDTVGPSVLSPSLGAVRPYGNAVTLLQAGAETDWKEARSRNLRVGFELMLTPQLQGPIEAQRAQAQILQQCADWIDRGRLRIRLAQTYPLSQVQAAHQLLEQGAMTGKVALTVA
ncbi:MAG: alcohol dehydrogenase [Cyanobacteria bacterium QS_8_64_29]|nr:MAG: alcohol dehydrogenase [Cyanobacteria bacterium QS_8_64_29]